MFRITIAPDPIFQKIAEPVTKFDEELDDTINAMFDTAKAKGAIGLGANMVGLLERIIIVDWLEGGESFAMVNPEIISKSDEMQEFEESSLSYPAISAKIKRPSKITVKYQDKNGNFDEMNAEGFLATIIQHEIDYLNGIVFLDYLSKLKQERLLKKMHKYLKQNPHGSDNCACC